MKLNKLIIKRLLIVLSISLNIFFLFWVYQKSLLDQESKNDENNLKINESVETDDEVINEYELRNSISYYQLFYGRWKVIEQIGSDLALPSRYSGFDEDGNFRGPDTEKIIGEEIVFDYDYVEYYGEKHSYVYGPFTYTHALLSEDDEIGYNYAKTLGITGNYYSIIYFLLPNNYQVNSNQKYVNEIRIDDLCYLYLKNNDTIYASEGGITYLLKRLQWAD